MLSWHLAFLHPAYDTLLLVMRCHQAEEFILTIQKHAGPSVHRPFCQQKV